MFSSSTNTTNKLNGKEIVLAMRSAFQQLFRHALQMSYQSQIWSEIASILQQSQPKLFDSSDNPAEALTIIECAESSISSEFLSSLANSYKNNANHLKTNFSYILIIIERLILKDHIEEASNFIEDTLEVHFTTAVDIDALLRMLIRICPQVNIDHRDQLCSKIIWSLSIKLKDAKCNKQSSSLFFDFALIILNLHFYPWKELASRCSDVIRSCAAYDTISEEEHSRNLDSLEDILRLIAERAQVNPSIIQAIHDEAPRAILRWSTSTKVGNKKTWCSHVYRMEQAMIVFIDQRQVTIDIFAQIIEALQKRIVNDEESDNKEESSKSIENFFINDIRIQIFHACELIGVINKQALVATRTDLIAFQSYAECRSLLDFIDEKQMSEENQESINRAQKEIAKMETLVIQTRNDMQNITKVVKRQEINMGGGDSLFEKIDTGIRNAKCILACVTSNYTKSTNCRREMSLSDALGKPIVPLLLKATSTWPPSGPMALVFTGKPYIDFCQMN
ncbi:unnamed protein product, partial [Rotaria sp. Silwood1]